MKGKENIWICMASYLKPKLLSIFVWWLSLVANLTDLESLKDKQLATPLRDSTLKKEVHGKCEQNPRSQKEALAFFLLAFSVLASTCILFLPLLHLFVCIRTASSGSQHGLKTSKLFKDSPRPSARACCYRDSHLMKGATMCPSPRPLCCEAVVDGLPRSSCKLTQ